VSLGKRVTIYTIAKHLGVSSTTVYRALNGKPRVSGQTKEAVLRAAKELGFKANTLAKSLARKPIRIAALISSGFPEFHRHVILGIKQTAAELHDYNVQVDYFSFDKGDNREEEERFFRDALHRIANGQYEGLLVQGLAAEEFQLLEERNIPVAVVVTDIVNSGRLFCVQYDGCTAGRLAAELLYWKLGKNTKIAIATGFPDIQIHRQTVQGFMDQTVITPLDVIAVIYNHDNEETAYMQTKELLYEHPGIRGIYVNSYNSSGVIRAVTEQGMAGKICLITSDINDELRNCLEQGTVSATIFQNQYRQGQLGLRYLYHHIAENLQVDDTISIKPEVIFRSNMAHYS
jgi:LacI family transcriptional regulator